MSSCDHQRFTDASGARLPGIVVPRAAHAADARGDAVIAINTAEHDRRIGCGLGAVTNLALLDRLLCLPLGHWVRWSDLTSDEQAQLHRAPAGVVEESRRGVRRVFEPAAAVPLVVVHARAWRAGLRRVSAFAPYASRVLVLHGQHRDLPSKLWEADFFGIGVWLATRDRTEELVAPQPWQQLYVKPAGWTFRERAYHHWLRHHDLAPRPPGSLW